MNMNFFSKKILKPEQLNFESRGFRFRNIGCQEFFSVESSFSSAKREVFIAGTCTKRRKRRRGRKHRRRWPSTTLRSTTQRPSCTWPTSSTSSGLCCPILKRTEIILSQTQLKQSTYFCGLYHKLITIANDTVSIISKLWSKIWRHYNRN